MALKDVTLYGATMTMPSSVMIAGLILAGGQASRMGGGDKALIDINGATLLARTIARARPQVGRLLLNANGDPARFAAFGLPVVSDPFAGQWGPLVGILAGLEHLARHWPDIAWMASFPTDCPFLPTDLVQGLREAMDEGPFDLAMASSEGGLQPVFGLWPVALADDLRRAILGGLRKVDQFARIYRLATREWPDDMFFNINSPDDVQQASQRL